MSAVKGVEAAGGAGSVAAAIADVGWPVVVLVAGLAVAVLLFATWVLNDTSRTGRLMKLIRAVRETKPPTGSA